MRRLAAHVINLFIGVAAVGGLWFAGYRPDGLSWIAGAVYALVAGAVHEAFWRGRK